MCIHLAHTACKLVKDTLSVSALGYDKCFVSKRYYNITIFKLIYLFWNKLLLDLALLALYRLPPRHVFSARFPEVMLLGGDDLFIPRHFQRLITGTLTGVDPEIYQEERLK